MYLSVLYEPETNYVRNADSFFSTTFKKDWLNNEFVRKMILDIDKTKVVQDRCLESPILGMISPLELSSGVKELICIYNIPEPYIYKGSIMGDNCFPWLFEITKTKDVHMFLNYCPELPLNMELNAIFTDSCKLVTTEEEFVYEFYRIRRS